MSEMYHRFIGDNSDQYSEMGVFFANLNLSASELKRDLALIIEMICNRMESIYKSPAKISFGGVNVSSGTITNLMQFDDLCIKLLHVDSGLEIYTTLSVKLARTLLIRLLATSLIDDAHGLMFSSTEKGIFSFLVTRLLFDLKNTLLHKMPSLKLIGIYHGEDEILHHTDITGFGIYHFSFTFAADSYPVIIAAPYQIFRNVQKTHLNSQALLERCGHLTRPMAFRLKTLNLSPASFNSMSFGDLILFDHSELGLKNQVLTGPMRAFWQDFVVLGRLDHHNNTYCFLLERDFCVGHVEDQNMEEIAIASAADHKEFDPGIKTNNHKLAHLAQNIRIPLSIELSRLPMTLKELSELKDGQIIDLHRRIDDPLEMVVEGKVIGYCHPVQIDGRLGIRVLSIDGDDNKSHS